MTAHATWDDEGAIATVGSTIRVLIRLEQEYSMATIHQIAEGAETLAATSAKVAGATEQLAAAATVADDVVRSSRNLMKWFIISLIVLAVAGAVMNAMKQRQSSES